MGPALMALGAAPPADVVGAKAARLGWLTSRGWKVPRGAAAPFGEIERLLDGDLGRLRAELDALLDPARRYAVRSSADTEDHGARSFAGQFATVLDVSGVENVLAAIRAVADSARSPEVAEYARAVGVDPATVRMSVIVQEMVAACVSGVAFSRDPVSGADRVVVEAIEGGGDRLVGRGATPQRWIGTSGGAVSGPVTSSVAGAPGPPVEAILPTDVVGHVVDVVGTVARAAGEPVDVEWVWDGTEVWLVQSRPITALTQSARTWSSRIASDVLPGLIPPLVWSVNVPVINGVWVDVLDEALGATGLDPESLARPFGYRAYFDMGAFGSVFASLGLPRDALEQMRAGTGRSVMRPSATAVLRRAPRLVAFVRGLRSWPRVAREGVLQAEAARLREVAEDVGGLTDEDLLARVDRLRGVFGALARLNVITPLLADVAAAAVRRAAERAGLDPAVIEPGQDLAQVRALDPALALAEIDPGDDAAWARYLERFGHLSDSPNDCSRPTWAEQEEAVRHRLSASQPAGAGRSTRPDRAVDRHAELLARTPAWRRGRLGRAWSRAAALRLAREHVGYAYARFYALFRPTFLEAGERLVARGVLAEPGDVFLLTLAELRAALIDGLPGGAALTARRRLEMTAAAELDWPETIVGDDPLPVLGRAQARVLYGTPTSRGRHTGPARVVTSLATAPEIGRQDVLVLEAADVTWTPLLLRAGAVVTQTGGMLSHASIVARELGLPCVAAVPGVTRLTDGTRLSVDGGSGEVLVLDDHEAPGNEGEQP